MKTIICTNLPFSFAKNPFFIKYAQFLIPGYVLSPPNIDLGDLIKDYDDFQFSIFKLLDPIKGFVSFTTNVWTSR